MTTTERGGFTERHAREGDAEALARLERLCFPPAEAASAEDFAARLAVFPEHFWLLECGGQIVSAINGMATDLPDLRDEMYHNARMHKETGRWQMIFGVATHPDYRNRGCASRLMALVLRDAAKAGRAGVVLTCKEGLLGFYERFGFVNEGISDSAHGNAVWYQMRRTFGGDSGG